MFERLDDHGRDKDRRKEQRDGRKAGIQLSANRIDASEDCKELLAHGHHRSDERLR